MRLGEMVSVTLRSTDDGVLCDRFEWLCRCGLDGNHYVIWFVSAIFVKCNFVGVTPSTDDGRP